MARNIAVITFVLITVLSSVKAISNAVEKVKNKTEQVQVNNQTKTNSKIALEPRNGHDYFNDYESYTTNNNNYNQNANYGPSAYAGLFNDYQPQEGKILNDASGSSPSSSKVKFPVDEAKDHLAEIHQNYNDALYQQQQVTSGLRGGRGLFPFQSEDAAETSFRNGFYGTDPAPANDPYSIHNFAPQKESFEELFNKHQQQQQQQEQFEQEQQAHQLNQAHYQNLQSQYLTGETASNAFGEESQNYLEQLQRQQKLKKFQEYLANQEAQQYNQPQQSDQYYKRPLAPPPPPPKPVSLSQPQSFPSTPYTNPYEQSFNGQSPFINPSTYQATPVQPFESTRPEQIHPPLTGKTHLPDHGFYHHPIEGEIYFGTHPPTEQIHSQPHTNPYDEPNNAHFNTPIPFKPLSPQVHYQPQQYAPFPTPQQQHSSAPVSFFGESQSLSPYQQQQQFGQYPIRRPTHQGGFFGQQEIGQYGGLGAAGGQYQEQFSYNRRQEQDSLGRRISRAIEEISKNDDLQCVPKLVCQMIGSRMTTRPLPSFIDGNSLASLIQSVPVETPSAVYIRAALLGITNGNNQCQGAYNRCPREESDVLYYLNNHRGGFFKFFSGEDNTLENKPHQNRPQYQDQELGLAQLLGQTNVNKYQGNPPSQLNLLALQNIAAALMGQQQQGGGLFGSSPNRGQFGQQVGGGFGSGSGSGSGGLNLASLGSGLSFLSTLASFFGNGGRSRITYARSLDDIDSNSTESKNLNKTLTYEEEVEQLKEIDVKSVVQALADSYKKLENEKKEKTTKVTEVEVKKEEIKKIQKRSIGEGSKGSKVLAKVTDIEPRIVNRSPILATHESLLKFPEEFNQEESNREEHIRKLLLPAQRPQTSIFVTPLPPVRPESLPLKTGTGNLLFDSDQFHKQQKQKLTSREEQIREILKLIIEEQNSEREREEKLQKLQDYYTNTHRFAYGSSNNNNNYFSSYRPQYSSINRPSYSSNQSYNQNKIYVTNSQGQNEYYIDTTNGKKYYIR